MAIFYPLKFKPHYLPKIWGGRNLTRFFNRPTPTPSNVGESWELFCNEYGSSEVSEGQLAGRNLRELLKEFPVEIYGRQAELYKDGFPLIFKLINAEQQLSIQVHPDERYANKYENGHGKPEAWYLVDTRPDAIITRGFKPGVTAEKAKKAIREGKIEEVVHTFPAEKGQSVYVPPGTVHGIGKGILAAEIAQNSDLTYRAYDYNRTDEKGEKRQLHVEKVLDVLKLQDQNDYIKEVKITSLCAKLSMNDCFSLYRYRFREPIHDYTYNQFRILCNLEGHGTILSPDNLFDDVEFGAGDTILIPACLYDFSLIPATTCTMLEMFAGRFDKSEDRKQPAEPRELLPQQ